MPGVKLVARCVRCSWHGTVSIRNAAIFARYAAKVRNVTVMRAGMQCKMCPAATAARHPQFVAWGCKLHAMQLMFDLGC